MSGRPHLLLYRFFEYGRDVPSAVSSFKNDRPTRRSAHAPPSLFHLIEFPFFRKAACESHRFSGDPACPSRSLAILRCGYARELTDLSLWEVVSRHPRRTGRKPTNNGRTRCGAHRGRRQTRAWRSLAPQHRPQNGRIKLPQPPLSIRAQQEHLTRCYSPNLISVTSYCTVCRKPGRSGNV
jgi:hypothetical protein